MCTQSHHQLSQHWGDVNLILEDLRFHPQRLTQRISRAQQGLESNLPSKFLDQTYLFEMALSSLFMNEIC